MQAIPEAPQAPLNASIMASNWAEPVTITLWTHEKQINKKDLELLKCDEEDAKYKIEVWNGDPFILSLNNAINPVYILRLLNNVDDERIQDAVRQIENELIKKFKDINERDWLYWFEPFPRVLQRFGWALCSCRWVSKSNISIIDL